MHIELRHFEFKVCAKNKLVGDIDTLLYVTSHCEKHATDLAAGRVLTSYPVSADWYDHDIRGPIEIERILSEIRS